MDIVLEKLGVSEIELIMLIGLGILLIMYLINTIKYNKLNKRYRTFLSKFSKGANIEVILREYLGNVKEVKEENKNIKEILSRIEKNTEKCIQKVGIVRYNAFSDTGSDLCFALALLDFEDNGIVLNGIYSRDNTTTTYAKPIEKGKSIYVLAKEEAEAIEKAKQSAEKYYINVEEREI